MIYENMMILTRAKYIEQKTSDGSIHRERLNCISSNAFLLRI